MIINSTYSTGLTAFPKRSCSGYVMILLNHVTVVEVNSQVSLVTVVGGQQQHGNQVSLVTSLVTTVTVILHRSNVT